VVPNIGRAPTLGKEPKNHFTPALDKEPINKGYGSEEPYPLIILLSALRLIISS
jgi:hypothetical protein